MAKAARSNLAEGWIRVAEGQTQAAKPPQGRADLRALTQPDPTVGRGSPKTQLVLNNDPNRRHRYRAGIVYAPEQISSIGLSLIDDTNGLIAIIALL
ncbi:hypothetical protein SapgrDRAFT_2124 [Saprospira grandis DSM 2844]|uniref:Uncharacterized protein n=1 Tax=Saprospira grandis DSM 2844 TaxID=694433 RepID=J1I5Z3_9BACT|nr:hypothetical protein SapgrDRAFT_2124 [Saprospira grandis DSM 2844]